MQPSRALGHRPLYVGDTVGVMEEGSLCSFGRVGDRELPPVSQLESNRIKSHLQVDHLRNFYVTYDGNERDYVRNYNVEREMMILDRPWIKLGSKIRKEGCTAVAGIVTMKEVLATVTFVNNPELCLPNVPLDRLYSEIYKPVGQKYVNGPFVGEIKDATYEVSVKYDGRPNGETCTTTVKIPSDEGYLSLYLGQAFKMSREKLGKAQWSVATTFITRLIKQHLHSDKYGQICKINMKEATNRWIYNYETKEPIAGCTPTPDMDGAKFFPPIRVRGRKNGFSIKLTPEDIDNITKTKDWENSLFPNHPIAAAASGGNGDGDGEPSAKVPRTTEPMKAEECHAVVVHLTQSKIGVTWNLNEQDSQNEELFSCQVAEIVDKNTLEIAYPTYVLPRFPTPTTRNLIGFVRNYYPGEATSSVNPKLNPSNMKHVIWFATSPTRQLVEHHSGECSVYELLPIDTRIFTHSILVADTLNIGPRYTVGCFEKLTDNGMVRIRDVDGGIIERWPNAVELYNRKNVKMDDVFENARIENNILNDGAAAGGLESPESLLHFDFPHQCPRLSIYPTNPLFASIPDTNISRRVLGSEIEEIFQSPQQNRQNRTWYYTFQDRFDFFTVIMRGDEDTPNEDMIYSLHVQLPQDYPNSKPIIHFPKTSFHDLTPTQLRHLQKDKFDWQPETSKLSEFLEHVRKIIIGPLALIRTIDIPHEEINIEELYPPLLTSASEWKARENELAKMEELKLVFRKMTSPAQWQLDAQMKGHYNLVLNRIIGHWRTWENKVCDEEFPNSAGFDVAVNNVSIFLESRFGGGGGGGSGGSSTAGAHPIPLDPDHDPRFVVHMDNIFGLGEFPQNQIEEVKINEEGPGGGPDGDNTTPPPGDEGKKEKFDWEQFDYYT